MNKFDKFFALNNFLDLPRMYNPPVPFSYKRAPGKSVKWAVSVFLMQKCFFKIHEMFEILFI